MHLIYLDESGNTGANLDDGQQPLFVLAALIVPEDRWQQLEQDLESSLSRHFPAMADSGAEVHAADLRSGRNSFGGVSVSHRIALRDEWLSLAESHDLKVVYRAIEKARFKRWLSSTLGDIKGLNPHVAAFPLVARVVDEYLCSVSRTALGMFISDENAEVIPHVERSIKSLRATVGTLRLSRIIEKGFFIDSKKSRPLQLADLCALTARKLEEVKLGLPAKSIDASAAKLLEPLVHRGNESLGEVLPWLSEQQRPSAKK